MSAPHLSFFPFCETDVLIDLISMKVHQTDVCTEQQKRPS